MRSLNRLIKREFVVYKSRVSRPWGQQRRHELDGLRVIAFGLLILYHIGLIYVPWEFHIASSHQSEGLTQAMMLLEPWRMSLLFLISGAALWYAQAKVCWYKFIYWRSWRLNLPLLFGLFVVVPPQLYFEMSQKSALDLGFFDFWLAYLRQDAEVFADYQHNGTSWTWNHLWYLPYLFCYSLIAIALSQMTGIKFIACLDTYLKERVNLAALVIVPVIYLLLVSYLLRAEYPPSHDLINDWYLHSRYFAMFILGFWLIQSERVWSILKNWRKLCLALSLTMAASLLYIRIVGWVLEGTGFTEWIIGDSIIYTFVMATLFALLGYSQLFLTQASSLFKYLNGAVYTYYILHQTVIIVIGYWLIECSLGPWLEPLLLLSLTLLVCALGYEVIRRIQFLRPLFGMSWRGD